MSGVALADVAQFAGVATNASILAVLLGFWLKKSKDDRDGFGVLIVALQNDVANVRQLHRDCEEEVTQLKHRVAELEGYNIGRGEAKQEAQLIVSADREARKGGK